MKLVLALLAVLSLTACGTMGGHSCGGTWKCPPGYNAPKLTKADLVYFPETEHNLASKDECEEVLRRLNAQFPSNTHPHDNFRYWIDTKTQKAYTFGTGFMFYDHMICRDSGNKLKVKSLYAMAEEHQSREQSKADKKSFVNKRVDKLGL